MIRQNKLWMLKANNYTDMKCSKNGDYLTNPIVEAILYNRGLATMRDSFLKPAWRDLHDPYLLRDMEKAAARVQSALLAGERICVYGDYDADGITATTLLVSVLRLLGGNVDYYIPDRISEGYGLNSPAIEKLAQSGVNLIVSVDCGISGHDQAHLCNQLGVDLIITDHHEPPDAIPDAYAVVNPKREDCQYPHKGLAGVGVAFKLVQALWRDDITELRPFLDLVALGTVADIVPLLDENRFLVSEGLSVIREHHRIGLGALLDVAGASGRMVDADTLGFTLGPRINAAGRVGSPSEAVKLLMSAEEGDARDIASCLDQWNRQRQQVEADILADVLNRIEEFKYEDDYVLVVDGNGWHPGVVGIVSSRITEQFGRPSIILTRSDQDGILKGSGRSIPGFNLYEALKNCQGHLLAYGGHEQAAGLSMHTHAVDDFRIAVNVLARNVLTEEDLMPALSIDMEIPHENLSLETAESILSLAPFGEGNRAPLFVCRDLLVSDIRAVGSGGSHLKLKLLGRQGPIDGIAFSFGAYSRKLSCNDRLDVLFSLDINSWNGRDSVQLMIRDMKISDLADNLMSGDQHRIYIDAFDAEPLGDDDSEPVSTDEKQSHVLEYWAANQTHRWEEFCRILRESLQSGEKTCVLVSTREQCRHVKQLILNEMVTSATPLVLHRRMDIALQQDIWQKFLAGRGNPLIFTGYGDFLKREPSGMSKLLCLYPFYAKNHFQRVRTWAGKSGQRVEVHYLFSENQLMKNMQLLKHIFPDRNLLSKVYVPLRNLFVNTGETELDLIQWSEQIHSETGMDLLADTILNSLTVFQDLNLIRYSVQGLTVRITWLGEPEGKLNLEDSALYSAAKDAKNAFEETFMNFHV
jgi:single-stranded-DNA-specific exonuclease